MPTSYETKQNKLMLRKLPHHGENLLYCHGRFNNLISANNLPSKKFLDRLPSLYDIDLFNLNADNNQFSDSDSLAIRPIRCKYYSPHSFLAI